MGWATGSVTAGVATVASGFLIDADHLVEFWEWFVRRRPGRYFVLGHAWEYFAGLALALSLWGPHPILLGVVVGYGLHLITDSLSNDVHPLGYFLTYRIAHRFEKAQVAQDDAEITWERVQRAVPMGRYFLPVVLSAFRFVARLLRIDVPR